MTDSSTSPSRNAPPLRPAFKEHVLLPIGLAVLTLLALCQLNALEFLDLMLQKSPGRFLALTTATGAQLAAIYLNRVGMYIVTIPAGLVAVLAYLL